MTEQEEELSQRLPDTCPISQSSQQLPNSQISSETPWGRLYPTKANYRPLEFTKEEYTVGRAPDCDLELRQDIEESVYGAFSKVHFRIKRKPVSNNDFVVYLEDLSFNGTFVNGEKVGKGKSVVLESNDEISLIFRNLKDSETKNYPEEVRKKYAISRILGSGACGIVKLVFEKSTGKAFAMKIIQKKRFWNEGTLDVCQIERMRREVYILRALSHAFIVRFENVFDSSDHLFIVTEYVEGGELLDRVDSGHLPEKVVKFYFYQLAYAIKYLHGEGIIHRDVKLENILLASHESETVIKLSDFGFSRFLDSESMMTFCGTPFYIAPEILKTKGKAGTYDEQVDIWSMGVVLYTCLSGKFPFSEGPRKTTVAGTRKTLTEQILSGRYDFPKSRWASVSSNAINLVRRMLTVNPKKRITIEQIFSHPWLNDKSIMNRVKLLMNRESPPRAIVRQRHNLEEESVKVKKAKLTVVDEEASCSR